MYSANKLMISSLASGMEIASDFIAPFRKPQV